MSTACLGVLSVLQPIFYTVYCIFAYKTGYIAFPTRVLFWMPIVCALYYEPKNRYYLPIAAPIGAAVMAANYGIYRLFPNEIYMAGSAFISTFFAIFTASCIALLAFYISLRVRKEKQRSSKTSRLAVAVREGFAPILFPYIAYFAPFRRSSLTFLSSGTRLCFLLRLYSIPYFPRL